jgi:predicted acetyltransferase
MSFEIGAARGEADLHALARIEAWCFGVAEAAARVWLEKSGVEHVRVARRGAEILGGLIEIPMGQWFGGRSVPMLGVAGVAVAPATRGERVALTLMVDALRAARARGFVVSTLYPAAVALYRAAGYEYAGHRHRYKADLKALPTSHGELKLTRLEPDASGVVEALYRALALERTGYLDRGPYVWRRVRENREGEANEAFGVWNGSSLEGYAYLSQRGPDDQRELVVNDFAAATSAAATRLVALFADHRSTMKSIAFAGGAPLPLILAPTEPLFRIDETDTWMTRVVEPAGALVARGYPDVETAVDLELTDRVLPENSGRYRLEVSRGRAEVTRGGTGAVALDERALAALYTGFFSPAALVRGANLAGDAVSLGRLALLFAGPPPSLCDYF